MPNIRASIEENTVCVEGQVNLNETAFYLGVGDAKVKAVILGNSITRHGVCPEIGWYGLYGMAASCEEKDYVHRLADKVGKNDGSCCFFVNQIAEWERSFDTYDLRKLQAVHEFSADILIFRCGENIVGLQDTENFRTHLCELLDYLAPNGAFVVLTTCFWKNEKVDACLRDGARARRYGLVELGDLGDDESMKAKGLFEHSGVAAHPGDKGMEYIAERIYCSIKDHL